MDSGVIEHLTNRIRASYRAITKNLRPNDEDDCVQECLFNYHTRGRGQPVEQAVIDYLRLCTGRKDSGSYENRLKLNSVVNFKEHEIADPGKDSATIDLSLVYGRTGEVFKMYCFGYTEKEIGEHLGVSESRVSQLLNEAIAQYQVMCMVPKSLRDWVNNYAFKRRNASFR